MTISTIALLLLSVLIAAGLSYFQYFYKNKSQSKLYKGLAFLRFLIIFGILLLLINPIISRKTYETVKTPLAIVVDNSKSIAELKADAMSKEVFEKLATNSDLKEKFDLQLYRFDSEFEAFEER